MRRDPGLDTLLALDGDVFVINEFGYWVKFTVNQVPVTTDKPHGLDYSLTMHAPDGGIDWLDLTTLTKCKVGRAGRALPRTIGTGYGQSNPTTTPMPPRC